MQSKGLMFKNYIWIKKKHVCLQKVVDKSGKKLREGFRLPILPSQYSRKS